MQLPLTPLPLFLNWFEEAKQAGVPDPTVMTLATATKEGAPSARIVLLKDAGEQGFSFFTNFTSRKGKEIANNPKAALCFYWEKIDKQVRIEGRVEKVMEKEADDYFSRRPRGSQIGAWASKQSLPMEKDDELVERVRTITEQFQGGPIPRPPFWSGFRVVPERIEFWKAGEYRLHTRITYTRTQTGWAIERLYP